MESKNLSEKMLCNLEKKELRTLLGRKNEFYSTSTYPH